MLKKIKDFFSPPTFEDEAKTRSARYLNAILIVSFLLLSAFVLSGQYVSLVATALFIINISVVGMYILLRNGRVTATAITYVSVIWIAMTYLAWTGEGVLDIALMIYVVLILLASLLGNSRISVFLTTLSVIAAWALFFAEENELLTPVSETLLANTISTSGIFIIAGVIIYYTVTDLERNLISLKRNEKNLLAHNKKLLALQENLQEHTSELEKANQKSKEQTARLKLIAEISQEITLTQDLTELLSAFANKISDVFNFYHVDVFFLEEDEEVAKLQATNNLSEKEVREKGYQVETSGHNFIARVIREKKSLVALEIDKNHRDFEASLPETRSKIGLPLNIREKIIGVLDIQSAAKHIFSEEEVEAFQSLANQAAIAVENARQATITQSALREAQETSRRYVQQAWRQVAIEKRQQHYNYANKSAIPLSSKRSESLTKTENIISIPVQLHEEIIGYVEISRDSSSKNMSSEEEELVQAIVNRAALELENARLLENSQRLATKEKIIGDISEKLNATTKIENLMQVAVKELQDVLGASDVVLQIEEPKNQG
ncbi:MAG: GAF domain-containing protein [Chloroflexi bacterium]|nr:GAF domain-containing protein [Chloroflexota bacterium]